MIHSQIAYAVRRVGDPSRYVGRRLSGPICAETILYATEDDARIRNHAMFASGTAELVTVELTIVTPD